MAALQHLSRRCCVATGSLKYKDSSYIKELCRQRRCLTEPQERVRLSRVILAQRAHERRKWWAELEGMAGAGDSRALAFIRKRAQTRPYVSGFVASAGGRTEAATQLKEHFKNVLASASKEEVAKCAVLLARLHEQAEGTSLQPFTKQEVAMHIQKFVHSGKTSGCSGVPAELIVAVASTDDGMVFCFAISLSCCRIRAICPVIITNASCASCRRNFKSQLLASLGPLLS